MQIALIADIHGNAVALGLALAELDRLGVERVVCLGDVAATGPQPGEAVAMLRERDIPTVMGNADAEIVDPPDPSSADGSMQHFLEMSRWGHAQLTEDDKDFISGLPPALEIDLGLAQPLLCVHGSPRSFDDVIRAETDPDALDDMLAGQAATIIAGGHTHIQMLRRHRSRLLLNPGAVGLAYDPAPPDPDARCVARAEFAVIDVNAGGVACQLHRLPYDPAPLLVAARAAGMPHAEWWISLWAR